MQSLGCVAAEMLTGIPPFKCVSIPGLMYKMDRAVGPFPEGLVRGAPPSADCFFTPDGRMKSAACLRDADPFAEGHTEPFAFQKLRDNVMTYSESATGALRLSKDKRTAREEFRDMLLGMLTPDPASQFNAAQALAFPFMARSFGCCGSTGAGRAASYRKANASNRK